MADTYFDNVQKIEFHATAGRFVAVIPKRTLDEIGEVVFCEHPTPGREYRKGEVFCTVETAKKCFFLEMPCDGKAVQFIPTFDVFVAGTFQGDFKPGDNCEYLYHTDMEDENG